MFGFVFSPFYIFLPLIFIFVIARVAAGFIRGISRRQLPPDDFLPGQREHTLPAQGQRSGQEARMFKLGYRLKGRITVSDIVVETGLGIQEAEELIQSMVDNAHVRMEVDPETGIVTYEFPEIIRRFEQEDGPSV